MGNWSPANRLVSVSEELSHEEIPGLTYFNDEVSCLLSSDNSTFISLEVAVSRWLNQFHLHKLYSEAYVINEAYIRGVNKVRSKGIIIHNVPAWLKRTSFNIIRELSKREGRYRPLEFEISVKSKESACVGFIPTLDLDQEMMYVRLAFQLLQPEDQEILNFKIVDRLSWKEIHKEFQLRGKTTTITALRKRKQRALKKLRKHYHSLTVSPSCSS